MVLSEEVAASGSCWREKGEKTGDEALAAEFCGGVSGAGLAGVEAWIYERTSEGASSENSCWDIVTVADGMVGETLTGD